MNVESLRKLNWKVRVTHKRLYRTKNGPLILGRFELDQALEPDSKGGITIIEISRPDSDLRFTGVAECSLKDNFNRKTGVNIALGRAYKQLVTWQAAQELLMSQMGESVKCLK